MILQNERKWGKSSTNGLGSCLTLKVMTITLLQSLQYSCYEAYIYYERRMQNAAGAFRAQQLLLLLVWAWILLDGIRYLEINLQEKCIEESGIAAWFWIGESLCLQGFHTPTISNRIVTTAFGRPPRLCATRTTVSLPAEIDDEYLSTTDGGRQPGNKPSRLTFIIKSLELSAISERFPRPNDDASIANSKRRYTSQDLGLVLGLCTEMNEFLMGLPEHLRYNHYSTTVDVPSWHELQAHILKTR